MNKTINDYLDPKEITTSQARHNMYLFFTPWCGQEQFVIKKSIKNLLKVMTNDYKIEEATQKIWERIHRCMLK